MQAQNPLNILIVDDEPLARDRLRTLLSDLAVQLPSVVVGEAANGLQALDFLRDIGRHFSVFYRSDELQAGLPEAELRAALKYGRAEEEGWRKRKDDDD